MLDRVALGLPGSYGWWVTHGKGVTGGKKGHVWEEQEEGAATGQLFLAQETWSGEILAEGLLGLCPQTRYSLTLLQRKKVGAPGQFLATHSAGPHTSTKPRGSHLSPTQEISDLPKAVRANLTPSASAQAVPRTQRSPPSRGGLAGHRGA